MNISFSSSWLYQGSTHSLVRDWLEPQTRWSNSKTDSHLENAFFSRSPVFYFFQLPIFLLRFIPLLVIVTTFELNKSLQNIICHISTNTMIKKGIFSVMSSLTTLVQVWKAPLSCCGDSKLYLCSWVGKNIEMFQNGIGKIDFELHSESEVKRKRSREWFQLRE